MSDNDKQQAEGVPQSTPQAPADTTAAGSQPDNQGDGAGQAGQQPASEGTKANDAGTGTPASKVEDKPQESGSQQDFKPRSRSSARYRIEQLARENAELRKQVNKPAEDDRQQDQGDPQPDQTSDVRKAAREEAQKLMEPVLKEHSDARDESEIGELFSGDNAAKRTEYETKIREAWKLDQYKDLAASDVLKILSYDKDLAQARLQAVEDYKKAQIEAKNASGSGDNNTIKRNGEGGKDVANMTAEELEAHNARIKAGLPT